MIGVRNSAMTVILVAAMGLSPCANAQTSDGEVLTLDEEILSTGSSGIVQRNKGLYCCTAYTDPQ
jgi:hypothetical protein